VDLGLTLGPLQHGAYDPTIRFERDRVWVALRMPGGPAATLLFAGRGSTVEVAAWGPGSEAALDAAPGLLGAFDEPARLEARDRAVRELVRHLPGLRMTRTRRVMDALVPAILEQKVTGLEAQRAWRRLIRVWGTWAPGPAGLRLPPTPAELAARPYHHYHAFGVEARRADLIRAVCRRAEQLERLVDCDGDTARRRLCSIPGIGPWTAAEVTRVALGDPDAVSVGDYHVPNAVAWTLAGELRADDARMLTLLEPYRGQRARVVRLIEAAGQYAPKRGPRAALRSIAAI
jgi:3-methyladenine DNA glycosylase/8-oxoguanine DNA glycosylase